MPEQKGKLDFASGQRSSDEQLAGAIPQSVNVLVDAMGAIHVRPGISAWGDFDPSPLWDNTTSVDGITIWNDYPVYVTSDRLVHAQLAPGNGQDLSDATATTQLDAADRPVFATTRTRVVIAGGGALQAWAGPTSGLSGRLSGSAPNATHVVAIAQRLVVNPVGLTGQIQWSDTGDAGNLTWIGEFMELESQPDPLPALYENTGELIGGGTETVQTIAPVPDPEEFFQSVRTWSSGFGAPYSFAANDETFGFLDSRRRIQLSNGRSYKAISDLGITESLQALPTISDCWGFRVQIAGWNLLGWHFPTAGRTFIFDVDRETWSEWRGYSGGQWTAWAAKSLAFWPEQNLHLVGLGDGTIAKLDTTAVSDMGDPVVADIYTGFTDHGVDNFKQHISTRFTFKRGLGAFGATPGPHCQLFWRDSTGAWEEPYELPLGNVDDPNPVVEVRSLGVYRTRQWRLRMSDGVPLTFVGATETFEVLET
jgi:hypothetical protein